MFAEEKSWAQGQHFHRKKIKLRNRWIAVENSLIAFQIPTGVKTFAKQECLIKKPFVYENIYVSKTWWFPKRKRGRYLSAESKKKHLNQDVSQFLFPTVFPMQMFAFFSFSSLNGTSSFSKKNLAFLVHANYYSTYSILGGKRNLIVLIAVSWKKMKKPLKF